MEKSNLTLTQRVAILWLKNVDNSLFIFKFLRDLSLPFRILFYAGIIAFTVFGLAFASSFINFDDAPGAAIWQLLGDIIFYGTIAGMTLITTLESVYKLEVAQILADIKQQKQEIKAQKLQKWRLININIFLRIFIYISLYMFMFFIIETSANGAYNDIFGMAPNNEITQAQKIYFISEYNKFVQWFTFLYIISGLTLDYFVLKNRAKRREVQNESV